MKRSSDFVDAGGNKVTRFLHQSVLIMAILNQIGQCIEQLNKNGFVFPLEILNKLLGSTFWYIYGELTVFDFFHQLVIQLKVQEVDVRTLMHSQASIRCELRLRCGPPRSNTAVPIDTDILAVCKGSLLGALTHQLQIRLILIELSRNAVSEVLKILTKLGGAENLVFR